MHMREIHSVRESMPTREGTTYCVEDVNLSYLEQDILLCFDIDGRLLVERQSDWDPSRLKYRMQSMYNDHSR